MIDGLLQVVRKELAVFWADRQGALLTILIPVLLAGLVGMLFAPKEGAATMDLLVVTAEDHPAVAGLIADLDADSMITVTRVSEAEARRKVAAGDAPAALLLPKGVGDALSLTGLFTGEHIQVTLLQDPSHTFEAGFAGGKIQQALFTRLGKAMADPKQLATALTGARLLTKAAPSVRPEFRAFLDSADTLVRDAPDLIQGTGDGQGLQLPLKVTTEDVAGSGGPSDYNSYAHTFAGMLCMFLMFGSLAAGKGLVEEREQGSLVRLQMAPVAPGTLLVGVGVGAAVIALIISAAVYLAGMLVFDIQVRGSWLGFVAVHLGQAVYVGGFALLLAGVGRTARQIDGLGTFAVLVMSFLGGAWLPSFLMPDWLDHISLLIPTRWATDGLAAMTWRGLPLADGLTAAAVLAGFGVVLGAIGVRTFRWR
ncbi:MAG: ABC transporter permease [Myxococcales bacterium]|nr:ABC transporter permease [Myxococcales bacterium]MCB9524112.1 ABC transporter permease [Myxococcales bacterium]